VEAVATAVGQISTRERLLAAALAVFAEKGYRAATTREIAARAGVAELTLFRRFSSKQGLFEALLEQAQGNDPGDLTPEELEREVTLAHEEARKILRARRR
jgi:AcrR family transcriptional regulator